MKLYGNSASGAWVARKRRNPLKALAVFLSCLLLVEGLYFTAIYSNQPFIAKWRKIYISTAMNTLSHQWLATALIPEDVIQGVVSQQREAMAAQAGLTSAWTKEPEQTPAPSAGSTSTEIPVTVTILPEAPEETPPVSAREAFFTLFHEIDEASMDAYLEAHPEVLDNGWENIRINEAGLNQRGTAIQTVYGEQVLAIDAPNQILLIRVEGSGYRGVLAVAKDPAQLSLQASSKLGVTGETAGTIAQDHNGVLAMTGSGFSDPNGNGNGGTLLGYAMCSGTAYGSHAASAGEKRLELHEDHLMYIYDAADPVSADCTDAVEWSPALVIDGQDVAPAGWYDIQPRACIGQSDRYEILMLVVEGRIFQSVGIDGHACTDILLRHGCMQAINLDGGASAILWYDGQYVTQCSNTGISCRTLPTVFVYEQIQ